MPPVLTIEKLTKDYGSFRALDSLNLEVAPGEVVGVLGPNGSGKTTALRTILGFLRPTSGHASVMGHDTWSDSVAARRNITYLPGELRLYESMTGRQLVRFLGKLRGEQLPDVDRLAARLDVDPDRRLTEMSSGMKRKIALLAILLPKVPLILLDEPTNTLDPTMRDELLEQILSAKHEGKAVVFSSHVLQEVEAVCDRVVFLRRGQVVHIQEMKELRAGRSVSARITGKLPVDSGLSADMIDGERLQFDHEGAMPELLHRLAALPLDDLRITPRGLSTLYKQLFGDPVISQQ